MDNGNKTEKLLSRLKERLKFSKTFFTDFSYQAELLK